MIMKEINDIEVLANKPRGLDWSLKAINVKDVWGTTKGEGVKVAVIDTGIDMTHSEFSDSLKLTFNMHNRTKDVTDDYGHGSHVAGLIAGKRTGVAPNAELYVAKVLDKNGHGNMANISDGITMAMNLKVDVLCMSLGVPQDLPIAIQQKLLDAYSRGITIVCAVGNDGKNTVEYPSFYDYVIAVGGVDKDLKKASFSNFAKQLDIVAPAVEVLSTYKDGNYARMSGTSMASPLVAGAIVLLISKYRKMGIELKPDDIKKLIATKLNEKHSYDYGWGVLDVAKLLS
jgi:subtilisin family serine protease